MEDTIRVALARWRDRQPNMGSESFRNNLAEEIALLLREKGTYKEYTDYELDEQKARASWVCSICGENTFEVDSDYIGTGTNHLGCELKSQEEIDEYIEDIDEQAYAQGRRSSKDTGSSLSTPNVYSGIPTRVVDDAGVDVETGKYVGDNLKFDTITEELYTDEPHEELPFREKNWLQKKHEDKVFGNVQKQIYTEMTADGLPEGGDAQAVLESHKLADEIVDNKDGKWIYESPDGGKTVFRRPFSDYDPKNKEEIDWETKEPTGRKFTEYNNGNWRSEDEG